MSCPDLWHSTIQSTYQLASHFRDCLTASDRQRSFVGLSPAHLLSILSRLLGGSGTKLLGQLELDVLFNAIEDFKVNLTEAAKTIDQLPHQCLRR